MSSKLSEWMKLRSGSDIRGNEDLLNASWQFSSLGSVEIYFLGGIAMVIGCLLQFGVLIACLVIFIRQRKNPLL